MNTLQIARVVAVLGFCVVAPPVDAAQGTLTFKIFDVLADGKIKILSDLGAVTDYSIHFYEIDFGAHTIGADYRVGKGAATGGLATTTGRNAAGASICVVTDTTLDGSAAMNLCSSAPVSIVGFVD
jgi:hypothetical protein